MNMYATELPNFIRKYYLSHELLIFKYWRPALWPANSPDLNPVDYLIWLKLQERVYRSQIRDVRPA